MSDLRTKVPIGAHKLLWTPGTTGGVEIDLGYTKDGAVLKIAPKTVKRTAHELAAPYGSVQDELDISADITLLEADMDTVAIGLGALKTTVTGTPSKISIDLNPMRGAPMSFGKLVFHPRKLVPSDKSQDKTVWNALVEGASDRIFKANDDCTVNFSFVAGAFWDSTASKWKIYTEGDPTTAVAFEV